MARSRCVSFEKDNIDKMETSSNNTEKNMARDKDFEINKYFTARVTRLDHFESTVKGIRSILEHNHRLEEQFKASVFGQIVYGVDGLIWSIQLVHRLLLSLLQKRDEEGSLFFRLRGQDIKFGREEFALITGLKFGNSEAAMRKIKLKEPPQMFARFFPECNLKTGVLVSRLMKVFHQDIVSGKVECSDDELLSMSYLMMMCEINSKAHATRVDIRYLHLASHWDELNRFPWATDSFITTTQSARKGILNAFNQKNKQKTYSIGGFPLTIQVWIYYVM